MEDSWFSLETPRLILRDLQEDDWPLIHALSQEAGVTRYQTWLRLNDETECRTWLSALLRGTNQRRPRTSYNLGLLLKPQPDAIGWLGFGDPEDPSKGEVDIGYALLPAFWNRGFMTEAVRSVIDYVFTSLNKGSVYATCASSNRASAQVLEHAGMRPVETWTEEDPGIGVVEEHRCYRLERADWALDAGFSSPQKL